MKIFISSTTYDVEDIRLITIEALKNRGHEVIYHESPTFPVKLNLHSHDVCLETIKEVDLVVCIIQSRYGGLYKGNNPTQFSDIEIEIKGKTKKGTNKKQTVKIPKDRLSITWCELYIAEQNKIPIITFVKKAVSDEKETRRRNQFLSSFQPAHVDDAKIFDLIDWITKKPVNNWIVIYNNIIDYKDYLQKWITEIEKNTTNPAKSVETTCVSESGSTPVLALKNERTPSYDEVNTINKTSILTFVEGESDRDFLRYIIEKLDLKNVYKFVVTYGKYRMLQESFDYVISYNSENLLFVVDEDNNLDERKSFEEMFKKIDVSNKEIVFAEPNLDEWIRVGLPGDISPRNIKKISYEIEYNINKAISKSVSFEKLVEVLKKLG